MQEDVVLKITVVDSAEESTTSDYVFRVQISASKTAVEPKSFNFKGLSPIKRVKTGSLYKYFLGNASSYEQAKTFRNVQ
ncbi:MAG: hypothetical protein CM15mP83_8610 [Flavobacteriaceae bacterium]|nr:MAG: hypothetical protein CM15mP83_8610 [Flavobacteriaceae bacterium]